VASTGVSGFEGTDPGAPEAPRLIRSKSSPPSIRRATASAGVVHDRHQQHFPAPQTPTPDFLRFEARMPLARVRFVINRPPITAKYRRFV